MILTKLECGALESEFQTSQVIETQGSPLPFLCGPPYLTAFFPTLTLSSTFFPVNPKYLLRTLAYPGLLLYSQLLLLSWVFPIFCMPLCTFRNWFYVQFPVPFRLTHKVSTQSFHSSSKTQSTNGKVYSMLYFLIQIVKYFKCNKIYWACLSMLMHYDGL